MRRLPLAGDLVDAPASRDDPLDSVFHHEVDAARTDAEDRLPALDRQGPRARDQGELFQLLFAVDDPRRDVEVPAPVREALLVPGLEDDVDLFLEALAVGLVVVEGGPQGLDLAVDVAAADAEAHPALGEDVGCGEVLGQPQRMPGRHRVEHRSELEPLRLAGEPDAQQRDVADAAVPLALKMVLGKPQGVVVQRLHQLRHGQGFVEHGRQVPVALDAVVDAAAGEPHVRHLDVAAEEIVEGFDHPLPLWIGCFRFSAARSAGLCPAIESRGRSLPPARRAVAMNSAAGMRSQFSGGLRLGRVPC